MKFGDVYETFTKAEIATMLKTYSHSAVDGDNPDKRELDSHIVNKKEIYEFPPIIRKVLIRIGSKKEDDVYRIARLIKRKPNDIRNDEKVINWLVEKMKAI